MKEWQIENSEKSEISEISKKLFRVFLFPSFRFFPTAKIENSDLKFLGKNFVDFRGFRVFDLALFKHVVFLFWNVVWCINKRSFGNKVIMIVRTKNVH